MIFKENIQCKRIIYPKGTEVPADFDPDVLHTLIFQNLIDLENTAEQNAHKKSSIQIKKNSSV